MTWLTWLVFGLEVAAILLALLLFGIGFAERHYKTTLSIPMQIRLGAVSSLALFWMMVLCVIVLAIVFLACCYQIYLDWLP